MSFALRHSSEQPFQMALVLTRTANRKVLRHFRSWRS